MNPEQARALVAETFPKPFDKGRFRNFALNLLNRFDDSKAAQWNAQCVKDAFKDHVARFADDGFEAVNGRLQRGQLGRRPTISVEAGQVGVGDSLKNGGSGIENRSARRH